MNILMNLKRWGKWFWPTNPIDAWRDWRRPCKTIQNSRSSGRDMKPVPPEYEADVLKAQHLSSINWSRIAHINTHRSLNSPINSEGMCALSSQKFAALLIASRWLLVRMPRFGLDTSSSLSDNENCRKTLLHACYRQHWSRCSWRFH
jgi:hypothetical protein